MSSTLEEAIQQYVWLRTRAQVKQNLCVFLPGRHFLSQFLKVEWNQTTNLSQRNEPNRCICLTVSQLAQDTITVLENNLNPNEFIKLGLFSYRSNNIKLLSGNTASVMTVQ